MCDMSNNDNCISKGVRQESMGMCVTSLALQSDLLVKGRCLLFVNGFWWEELVADNSRETAGCVLFRKIPIRNYSID